LEILNKDLALALGDAVWAFARIEWLVPMRQRSIISKGFLSRRYNRRGKPIERGPPNTYEDSPSQETKISSTLKKRTHSKSAAKKQGHAAVGAKNAPQLMPKPLARLEGSAETGKLGVMTKLLEKAFAEAVKLPKKEQDKLAKWLLAELESERRWDEAFARSTDQLAQLADEALKEHRKGRTKPLNPVGGELQRRPNPNGF